MRSYIRILLGLSMLFVVAGCNLPRLTPAISPMTEPPTATLSPEPPTPTATASVPTDWQTYTDQKFGFTFRYPKEGQMVSQEYGTARITDLSIAPDTNLLEKYLEMNAVENSYPCPSPYIDTASGSAPSQEIEINGLNFLQESGAGVGAGNIYEWASYSTQKENVCVNLTFVLHSANPGNYPTPPPVFNHEAESEVFSSILATFAWLNP